MLRLGYVKRCHEERATAAQGTVGPDSTGDPSGALGGGGRIRAAHCHLGGAGGGVAGTAPAEFAELLAPAVASRPVGRCPRGCPPAVTVRAWPAWWGCVAGRIG